jgi:hypothetical protein
MVEQLSLLCGTGEPERAADKAEYFVDCFSADSFCEEKARQALEKNTNPYWKSQINLIGAVSAIN